MKRSDFLLTVALILVVTIAVKYFLPRDDEQEVLDLPPESEVQEVIVEAEEPAIRYPVPEVPPQVEPPAAEAETTEPEPAAEVPAEETAAAEPEPEPESGQEAPAEPTAEVVEPKKPLPTLDGSDDLVRKDLYTLAARQALDSLLNLNRIIPRFVVTVDNLPRKNLLPSKYRSNQSVSGRLQVEEDSSGVYLSEKNYTRYEPFVDLLDSMDSNRLLALYVHYYPLFQAAFEDLGYPSRYFNDRLIDVIDHLLETPDIGGRISLVRAHVLYKYADPELEGRSAGQKVLIRIGPRNAARVKAKLRELRQALAG